MRIGIISDTHMPRKANKLPEIVYSHLCECDHIIHAGDVNSLKLIDSLEQIALVTAVAGNTDGAEIANKYGYRNILKALDKRIGVVHGNGSRSTIDNAKTAFKDIPVDCIVYGHSHIAGFSYHSNVLMFNPGSPIDKRQSAYFSFGVIDVKGELYPKLFYFDKDGLIVN